ncbi:helix-turn-helix domain-containing protein [Martelella sp. FOR1707]
MGRTAFSESQSTDGRAYGAHLAWCFGLPEPPTHVRRAQMRGLIAASEIRSDAPLPERTPSLGYDDAYQVAVHLARFRRELWLNGHFVADEVVQEGMTYIADLRTEPQVFIHDPWRNIQFYLPASTLKAYADQNNVRNYKELVLTPTAGQEDPVMLQLAIAVSRAMVHGHHAKSLLLDALLDAVCAHLLGQYGRVKSGRRFHTLAPWQERRAKELMDAHLDVSMSALAEACGLSTAHFSRAFKRSTGLAPHQWQIGRRLERAQILLETSQHSIAEIALVCGFSSQSHFQNTFKRKTGISPGRWRQAGATGPINLRPVDCRTPDRM